MKSQKTNTKNANNKLIKKDTKMKFKYKHPKLAITLKILLILIILLVVVGTGVIIGLVYGFFGDDWNGKYDYLKDLGVQVVYFPYGQGISSSNLKKRIYENYKKIQAKTDNHLPADVEVK